MIGFDRDAMLAAVKTIGSVVETRNTIPVLSNLLLRAGGGEIAAIATNLDLLCETRCAGDGGGEVTIAKDALIAALDGLRPGRIEMKIDGARAVMSQGRSRRTLPTLPASDFPLLVMDEDGVGFDISAPALARLFSAVEHAQETNEVRYYLCGVFLHPADGGLRAAATNGHALAEARIDGAADAAEMPAAIVATKTVALILKLIGQGDAIVRLTVGRRKLALEVGETRVVAKLIEGTFPDYARLFPERRGNALTIAAGELLRGLGAAAGGVEGVAKGARGVRFDLEDGDGLQLGARDGTGSETIEPIDARYAGASTQVGLSARYGRAVARMFREGTPLTLDFGSPKEAVVVTAEAEPDLRAVIMPMGVA